MKKILYNLRYHLLTFFILACYLFGTTRSAENTIHDNPYAEIKIIDTFTQYLEKDLSKDFCMANYEIGYIGPKVNQIENNTFRNFSSFEHEWDTNFKLADSKDLRVYVDTSRIIGKTNANPFYTRSISLNIKEDLKSTNPSRPFISYKKTRYLSHPVFVENISDDTLRIVPGYHLLLITEAIDSSGQWQPIQSHIRYGCGNGLPHLFLPNGEIIFTSHKITHGEYRTRIRLKYGYEKFIYSNEFYGKINYSQFKEVDNPRREY